MRSFIALLVAALLLPNIQTALAGSPDYSITKMVTDSQLAVGERGTLELEISNLSENTGYTPQYFLFLHSDTGVPPGGLLGNPLTILDGGQAVNFPSQGHSAARGSVSFRIPPVTPGKYFLVFVLSENAGPGFTEPEMHDADPANNHASLPVYVGLPDLVFTNPVVTRPTTADGDGSVTVSIQNIGDGVPRGSYLFREILLSRSTDITGGADADGFGSVAGDPFSFADNPHVQNPGYIEMPLASLITETFSIPGRHFREQAKTFYLTFRLTNVQDIRFPFAPNEPRILQRFLDGPLVEARTDNNVLIFPIHVTKPLITTPPASQSKRLGSTVVFGVVAADFNSFQWLFNGNPIPGETNATLTLTNLQASASGSYAVVVANEIGSVTSDPAVLIVELPPTVTQPPAGQIVGPGSPVTLTVSATGDLPFTYQWRRNSQAIPGATDASYTFNATEGGQFTVVVSNEVGSAESAPATVSLFSVETFAGTIIAGPLGGTYRIDYRNELDPADAWQTAATVTLTTSPTVWIDQDSPKNMHRFYRAVLVP